MDWSSGLTKKDKSANIGRAKKEQTDQIGLFFLIAPCALFILFFLVVYDDVLFDLFTGVLVDAERFRDL